MSRGLRARLKFPRRFGWLLNLYSIFIRCLLDSLAGLRSRQITYRSLIGSLGPDLLNFSMEPEVRPYQGMAAKGPYGVDFKCNRHCKTNPVDLGGSRGQVWPKTGPTTNPPGPRGLQTPQCLTVHCLRIQNLALSPGHHEGDQSSPPPRPDGPGISRRHALRKTKLSPVPGGRFRPPWARFGGVPGPGPGGNI